MLKYFFRPESVAVVGASTKPGKVGYDILRNLLSFGYKGRVYPINPKAKTILDTPVIPSIADLPEVVDLGVISLPAALTPKALRELGELGVKACVVVTSGFKEVGGEGAQLELELAKVVEETGIRMIGPNCVGIMDTTVGLNASFAADMPNSGSIGFFSQSGAMCLAILDWSLDNAIGFSKFISLGNKTDLSEAEILEMLADDPDTKVIMGYLEAVEDGEQFMKVAREVTRKKPIVLLKSGITAAGARAASSHTGALAGADAAYEAAFKQCGVLRAGSIKELFNLAQSLARQPLPNGPAIGIVTNSGGPGIIAADTAEQNGLHLAALRPESHEELREVLPAIASVYNPVDITGGAPSELYAKALKITADDPSVDSLLVIMSPTSTVDPKRVAEDICAVKIDKPVFSVLMGRHSVEESRIFCMGQGIPSYEFPEDAVQAIKGMLDYKRWLDSKLPEPEFVEGDKEAVAGIIAKLRSQGRLQMSENEARGCFAAYGIPVAGCLAAATSVEAADAAGKLGYPVVMKIDSPAISHKSDVGGVVVGLKNRKQVVEAFHDMTSRVRRIMPNAWLRGVLVQEMVPSGRECILGLNKDPQFGHLLMFGLGGIYVEVLKDVAFRVAPVSRKEATDMVKSIKSFALLQGVRGDMPADVPGLAQALLGLSTLAHDFPEIAEADINPLLVRERGRGVVAVDARISLTQQKGDE